MRQGDTVASIAARFGTTEQHLRELNELGNAKTLAVDSELRVPSSVTALPEQVRIAAARVDSRTPGRGTRSARGKARRHAVEHRRTPWHGLSTLLRINGLKTNSTLRIGQRLRLSGTATITTSSGGVTGSAPGGDGRKVTYVVRSGGHADQHRADAERQRGCAARGGTSSAVLPSAPASGSSRTCAGAAERCAIIRPH